MLFGRQRGVTGLVGPAFFFFCKTGGVGSLGLVASARFRLIKRLGSSSRMEATSLSLSVIKSVVICVAIRERDGERGAVSNERGEEETQKGFRF